MKKSKLLLLIPIYNDWRSVTALLSQIAKLPLGAALELKAMIIDDGSSEAPPREALAAAAHGALAELSVLELSRNLGHQSAIAVGLGELSQAGSAYDALVIMDGDGEDNPEDILKLIEAWKASGLKEAVFAERTRRSEGPLFVAFYALYRLAYRLLTGTWISMGNFSLLPKDYVDRLLLYPELWRHYPATVKKSRLPVRLVPTVRGGRLDGHSKMNFYNLILHGLGAITVHSDIVGVRSVVATGILLLGCALAALGLLYIRFFTSLALPLWSSSVLLTLSLIALQFLLSAIIFSFLTLAARSPIALNPARNYRGFVRRLYRVR